MDYKALHSLTSRGKRSNFSHITVCLQVSLFHFLFFLFFFFLFFVSFLFLEYRKRKNSFLVSIFVKNIFNFFLLYFLLLCKFFQLLFYFHHFILVNFSVFIFSNFQMIFFFFLSPFFSNPSSPFQHPDQNTRRI